jgi:hypothetical protein
MRCPEKYTKQHLVIDPVDNLPNTEEQIVCLLKQIRFLLFKLSESIAPSIFTSKLVFVKEDRFRDIYRAGGYDRVIEIQNISSLTDNPNDLIIRPIDTHIEGIDTAEVGLIVKPSERIRLHVPTGGTITAKFKEAPSIVAISELSF